MEICEQSQAFVEKNGDLVFDHTKLILRRGDDYFYARTGLRICASSTINTSRLEMNKIPMESVWPAVNPQFTPAPNPLPPNSHLKTPSLLYYGDTPASLEPSRLILNEVEACEVLSRDPHPNIVQYLGYVAENGRIRGLCFVKHTKTLPQRLKDSKPFDKDHCLQGIERGIAHMHKLGLIHNDLNPSNIMMDGENPVIIDFDSCKKEGDELGLKAGTVGWALDGAVVSKRENDFHGLSKIREFLMGGDHGQVHSIDMIRLLEHIPHTLTAAVAGRICRSICMSSGRSPTPYKCTVIRRFVTPCENRRCSWA